MTAALLLGWIRLRREALPLAGMCLGAFALLCAIALPLSLDLALSAAHRAAADVGGTLLRLSLAAAALGLGWTAIGPTSRNNSYELLLARPLTHAELWGSRITADVGALALGLVGGTAFWQLTTVVVGATPQPGFWWFAVLAGAQTGLFYAMTLLCSALLRGAAGPICALCWISLGWLHAAVPAEEGGWIHSVLGWGVPHLAGIDPQLGWEQPLAWSLTSALTPVGWTVGCLAATWAVLRLRDRA